VVWAEPAVWRRWLPNLERFRFGALGQAPSGRILGSAFFQVPMLSSEYHAYAASVPGNKTGRGESVGAPGGSVLCLLMLAGGV